MTQNIISSSRTFNTGEEGILNIVDTEGLTLTLPNDSTYNFVIGDEIRVFNDTLSDVNFIVENGVTLHSHGTSLRSYGYCFFIKVAANTWVGCNELS